MLVLSRKVGEGLVIGGGIVLKVLEVRGRRIRLGVEAGPGVTVLREELTSAAPEKGSAELAADEAEGA